MSEHSPMSRRANGGVRASLGDKAEEMRAALSARRDAESLLAEASALRRSAAADADTMVAEAQALARQLVDEARHTAERLTAEARDEAAELRRHLEQQRARARKLGLIDHADTGAGLPDRSRTLLADAEAALRDLTPALEGAASTVQEVIGSLAELQGSEQDPEATTVAASAQSTPPASEQGATSAATAGRPAAVPAVVPAAEIERTAPDGEGGRLEEAARRASGRLVAVSGPEPATVERTPAERAGA